MFGSQQAQQIHSQHPMSAEPVQASLDTPIARKQLNSLKTPWADFLKENSASGKLRQFPWNLISHLLLLVMTTWLVLESNGQVAGYIRPTRVAWQQMILPKTTNFGRDDTPDPNGPSFYFYRTNATYKAVRHQNKSTRSSSSSSSSSNR
jgi:hypothetical protein